MIRPRPGIPVSDRWEHDLQLVQRLISREAGAWSEFVTEYQALVFSRVLHVVREWRRRLDRADIEDMVAEVFSQLVANNFASLRGFQGRSSLSTWLTVITRRICWQALSRRETERPASQQGSDFDMQTVAVTRDDVLGRLIRSEDESRLVAAMEHLNERHRELLRLFYVEELSYQEIGTRMQMPMNSIGPTLQRAQQKLKELMEA
jgi:RNA polymerase sigma-70 factor (ECF subfamily)